MHENTRQIAVDLMVTATQSATIHILTIRIYCKRVQEI